MSASLLNDAAFKRQKDILSEAEKQGKVIYQGVSDEETRRMGISLLEMPADSSCRLVEEEIFGPTMAIVQVDVSFLFAQ